VSESTLDPAFAIPSDFEFGEVPSGATFAAPSEAFAPADAEAGAGAAAGAAAAAAAAAPVPVTASLGPLAAFTGTFAGRGFNTIFRPDSGKTPTKLPVAATDDNLLELNLTQETLSFTAASVLADVPNRGSGDQVDAHLKGVPYVQTIKDVTSGVGIHFEPGIWIAVPATTDPKETATFARMASIPHGTAILAQGTASAASFTGGKLNIPAVGITPFPIGSPGPGGKFDSQTATNKTTPRIPQDLTAFIANGTITQKMLDDPNTFLRNHASQQTITAATQIAISTHPAAPLIGGGTPNISFLAGNPNAGGPNAQTVRVDATFWIETVNFTVRVPVFTPGSPPLTIAAQPGAAGAPVPRFLVNPPVAITAPRTITVKATQIQYSQKVLLNFNGLTWPHVSVATLVPAGVLPVPASAFT
jgi:hypothetical protein